MSVRYDASSDRSLRTTDLLNYNSVYTWMAWVYLVSATVANHAFLAMNDNSSSNRDVLRTASADGVTLALNVTVAGASTSNNGTAISIGTWYHIALVRDAVNSLKLYLNGVLDITNTRNVTTRSTAATRMESGGEFSTNTESAQLRIDAEKAWSTNLSQAQVVAEMPYRVPVINTNVYGQWPRGAGATERLRDYSGNGRDWTASGTLSDEAAAPGAIWSPVCSPFRSPVIPVISGYGR